MAVNMSEVFAKTFPIKPEDIKTTPPEEGQKFWKVLQKILR